MKLRAYIETSEISYVTAKPSHDIVTTSQTNITVIIGRWWEMPSGNDSLGCPTIPEAYASGSPVNVAIQERLAEFLETARCGGTFRTARRVILPSTSAEVREGS